MKKRINRKQNKSKSSKKGDEEKDKKRKKEISDLMKSINIHIKVIRSRVLQEAKLRKHKTRKFQNIKV